MSLQKPRGLFPRGHSLAVPSLTRRGHFFERTCRPQITFVAGGIDANATRCRHLTTDTPSYTDGDPAWSAPGRMAFSGGFQEWVEGP